MCYKKFKIAVSQWEVLLASFIFYLDATFVILFISFFKN